MASNSFQLDLSQMFDVDIEEFLQKIQKQEPKERELFPPSLQQSTFIEHNDMTTCYQSGIGTLSSFRFFLSIHCLHSSDFTTIVCSSWYPSN